MAEAAIIQRLIGPRLGTTAVFLVDGVGIGAWAACVPAIRRALDLSDSALSLSLLAFAGGGIVAMPAASWLLTRMTSRRATILLATAIAVGMLLPGLARSLPVLVAAAFVFGMSKGALDVSMNTHAVAIQRAWGGPIMSSFHAAFSMGGLLGSIVIGFLFAQGFDVTGALGLMTLVALPVVATAAVLMRGMAPDPDMAAPAAAFAWPSRALLGIGLLCFLSMLIEGGMADWSGVYLSTVAGAATATAAAGYAAFSMMMVAGRLGGDWTVRRLGEARVLRLGAGLAALGFAIALGLGMPVPAMAGFALVGLGVSNIVPLLFSASARSGSVARSTAIAMTATVGYAGFLLGPPIIGFAADHVGLQLALCVLLLAAAFIAGFAARATRPGSA
jgi:MFS family permease